MEIMTNHKKAPESLRKVLYLCDRRACDHCGSSHCSHTEDIRHAANFQIDGLGNFLETPLGEGPQHWPGSTEK